MDGAQGRNRTTDTRIFSPPTQTNNLRANNGLERSYLSGHTFGHTFDRI